MDLEYKKLIFKARRGMLELDLLLKNFLKNNFDGLSSELRQQFSDLMDLHDPELLDLLINEYYEDYPEYTNLYGVIEKIIASKKP